MQPGFQVPQHTKARLQKVSRKIFEDMRRAYIESYSLSPKVDNILLLNGTT